MLKPIPGAASKYYQKTKRRKPTNPAASAKRACQATDTQQLINWKFAMRNTALYFSLLGIVVIEFMVTGFSAFAAVQPIGCHWIDTYTSELREATVTGPASLALSKVNIGTTMASGFTSKRDYQNSYKCNTPADYPIFNYSEHVVSLESMLAEGFSDVYQSNLRGVGIRLKRSNLYFPYEYSVKNAPAIVASPATNYTIEFVRTGREVESGTIHYNYTIQGVVMGKEVFATHISGSTLVTSPNYFSGCTGIEPLNIRMGKLLLADFDENTKNSFNLDVLCEGAQAGTQLPVKIYFEGNSPGAGRLDIQAGGAEGVEISLTNNRNIKLPFTKGSALSMTWTRSEPLGEIYRLPIIAQYTRKASAKITPGRADAVLNYILEYN